jgi:hypothetical protein
MPGIMFYQKLGEGKQKQKKRDKKREKNKYMKIKNNKNRKWKEWGKERVLFSFRRRQLFKSARLSPLPCHTFTSYERQQPAGTIVNFIKFCKLLSTLIDFNRV